MTPDETNSYGFQQRAKKINEAGQLVSAFIQSSAKEGIDVQDAEISSENPLSYRITVTKNGATKPVVVDIAMWGGVTITRPALEGKSSTTEYEFEVHAQDDANRIKNDICTRLTDKANNIFKSVDVDLIQGMAKALSAYTGPQPRSGNGIG